MNELITTLAEKLRFVPSSAIFLSAIGLILLIASLRTRARLVTRRNKFANVITAQQILRLHSDQPIITVVTGAFGLVLLFLSAAIATLPPGTRIITAHSLLSFLSFVCLAVAALLLWNKKRKLASDFVQFLEPSIPRLIEAVMDNNKALQMAMTFILKCCELKRDHGDVRSIVYSLTAIPNIERSDIQPELTELYRSTPITQSESKVQIKDTFAQWAMKRVLDDIRLQCIPPDTDQAFERYYFYEDLRKITLDSLRMPIPKSTIDSYLASGLRTVWGIPFFYIERARDLDKPMSSLEVSLGRPMGVIAFAATFKLDANDKQKVRDYAFVQARIIGSLISHGQQALLGTRTAACTSPEDHQSC